MAYRDFQLLLYVPANKYHACIQFYEEAFLVKPFYSWDEGEHDRGQKYDVAGTKLVILTQENPFPEYGPAHFQIEVEDIMEPYGWQMFRIMDPAGNHINIYSIP